MHVEQCEKVKSSTGFVAALDQNGGSTPKALRLYGITEDAYSSECDAAEPDRNGDCCAVFSGKVHPLGAILADGVATPPVTFDYKDRTESPAERNTHSHHAFRLTGSTNGDGAAAPGAQPLSGRDVITG